VTVPRARALERRAIARATIALVTLASAPTWAGSLSGPISGWDERGIANGIAMYEYVPAKLAASPPLLVISHQCGGSAAGIFGWASGLVAAADQYGFLIVYPQSPQTGGAGRCWDVSSSATQTRSGGGDSDAIREMVSYEMSKRGANADRVYAGGISSGAMMTELLLALYPDVFKAGAEFSGVPAGCANIWDPNGLCGEPPQTAQQWGNRARNLDPGYQGYRPRIQLWHGDADATIAYNNQVEAIKEWTDVLGLGASPTTSQSLTFAGHSWTRDGWQNSCGAVVLDAWTELDGPHNTDAPLNATYVIPFLGLDKPGMVDPVVAACPRDAGAGGDGGTRGVGGAQDGGGGRGTGGMTGKGGDGAGGALGSGAGGSLRDGGAARDSGGKSDAGGEDSASGEAAASDATSGCGCDLVGGGSTRNAGAIAALGLALAAVVRGRRRAGAPARQDVAGSGRAPIP
jgi:acetylxylan esterase